MDRACWRGEMRDEPTWQKIAFWVVFALVGGLFVWLNAHATSGTEDFADSPPSLAPSTAIRLPHRRRSLRCRRPPFTGWSQFVPCAQRDPAADFGARDRLPSRRLRRLQPAHRLHPFPLVRPLAPGRRALSPLQSPRPAPPLRHLHRSHPVRHHRLAPHPLLLQVPLIRPAWMRFLGESGSV